MAQITKRGNLQWRARIRRKGLPDLSKTFETRKDAEAWARSVEREMDRNMFIPSAAAEKVTVQEALERFKTEKLPGLYRGGIHWHSSITHLASALGNLTLASLDSSHVAKYRDQRLKSVGSQTVRHELGLLQRVLKACQIDWGIPLPRGLATELVRKPSLPQGRDRRLRPGEEKKLLEAAEACGGQISLVIRFVLETAMRRGEVGKMRWSHLDFQSRVLEVPETKTGVPRRVPVSSRALAVLRSIPRRLDDKVWEMELDSITHAFGRVCRKAGLPDLRFHDLRHEATSRLFEKKLDMMEVATITGHKTLAMLKRYTHLRAEDLIEKLG